MKKYIHIACILLLATTAIAQEKKWSLKDCIDHALLNNINVQQTALDVQLTKVDLKDAKGNFLPNINASASHNWNIGLNFNPITNLAETQTFQNTSAGLNLGIDIYKGLQNQNRLSKSRLVTIANQYQLSKIKDDVALNVANAFLQIIFNKENLKVQQELLNNNIKQQERTQQLVDAGSVPRGDLLDMKATVATSNQNVINAENALIISKLSLAQLLQIKDYDTFDVADDEYQISESSVMLQTPSSIIEKAKKDRFELKIAQTNIEIAEKDIAIAKGAYQPTLQGYYSFSTRATNSKNVMMDDNGLPFLIKPDPLFEQFSENKGHAFGLQLSIPIFNGFAVRNNVERAKINLEKIKTSYNQQELELERNVFTAITDAKGALKAYETAQITEEARSEAYNYAKEKFAVGLMNAFDLNQSQTMYANSQSDVLRTKYDYIFRLKVVEFYFGIPIILQ